jgi:hypothetical protein
LGFDFCLPEIVAAVCGICLALVQLRLRFVGPGFGLVRVSTILRLGAFCFAQRVGWLADFGGVVAKVPSVGYPPQIPDSFMAFSVVASTHVISAVRRHRSTASTIFWRA